MATTTKEENKYLPPVYLNEEGAKNLKYWQDRATTARDTRDKSHPEFDGMTYLQYLESNERLTNATIQPKSDPRDWRSRLRKRTVFSKINAVLGRIMEENFVSEFFAVNEENMQDNETARAITNAVEASKKIEGSQYIEYIIGHEMLKHGFCFVQESYKVQDKKRKKFLNQNPDPFMQKWTKAQNEAYKRQPEKTVLRADSVYLGDLSISNTGEQPYIITRTVQNYDVAAATFGDLPRWKYVKAGSSKSALADQQTYLDNWRMAPIGKDEVEIIECQDTWNDEYQVIIQGVPQLPPDYPIPWEHKGYNIRMRGVFLINPHFAYCHGLAHVMRSDSEMRDFFYRYMSDRSLQDLLKPYVSAANKVLTSTIFMPGRITHGLKPDDIQPLMRDQLPASAVSMFEMFEKSLDEDSISKIIAGQEPEGDPTAYQISVQQKMATRALGPIVLNYMWLLQDLDFLRCQTILEHFTKPKSVKTDPVTKAVTSTFHSILCGDTDLGDGEIGDHLIKFTSKGNHPNPIDIMKENEKLSANYGYSVKVSYIDGEMLRNLKYKIHNVVTSSPRKTSDINKILFGNFLDNAINYFGPELNRTALREEFARTWGKDPDKIFIRQQPEMGRTQSQMTEQPSGAGRQAAQQVQNSASAEVLANESLV